MFTLTGNKSQLHEADVYGYTFRTWYNHDTRKHEGAMYETLTDAQIGGIMEHGSRVGVCVMLGEKMTGHN